MRNERYALQILKIMFCLKRLGVCFSDTRCESDRSAKHLQEKQRGRVMEIFAKCRNIDETRQRIFSRGASMKIGPEKNYPENLVPIMECEKAGLIFFPEF